tara:strand:+ start:681 stop:1004 length:324 start_codon:yes stop_codon:yes gene_type:complete
MATNKTPLYQADYTFTGGKHTGSVLSTSEKGDLTFKKDGDQIRLDPNSSSAKFLLKQQKHELNKVKAQQLMQDAKAKKLVKNIDNSGEEEEFFHEKGSRVVKGPDTF